MLTGIINAQNQPFSLSEYKLPNLKRQILETRFDLSNSHEYQKSRFFDPQTDRSYRNLSGTIAINYYSLLNTPRIQRNTSLEFYGYGNYHNYKTDSKLYWESYNISPEISYNMTNRVYSGTNFFETDLITNFNYQGYHNQYFQNSNSIYDDKSTILFACLPFKVGTGRIEEVQDARHALYILDELGKQNRVSQGKSKEEILELASFISELKNKRFFDFREREIYEIEAVDSFLREKGYIIKSDARYFTTLKDFWDYGDIVTRNAGTRISAMVAPGYYFDKEKSVNDPYKVDDKLNSFYFTGGIEFLREKPISLSWQNTISVNAYYSFLRGKTKDNIASDESKLYIPSVQVDYSQNFGYYPNTRTSVVFGYSAKYVEIFDKTDVDKSIAGTASKGAKVSANLNVNYYISRKVRLNVSSSLYYVWQDSKDGTSIENSMSNLLTNGMQALADYGYYDKNLNSYLSIGLVYSIF